MCALRSSDTFKATKTEKILLTTFGHVSQLVLALFSPLNLIGCISPHNPVVHLP